jgi:putative hydrolase of HD superfamily
MVRKGLIDKLYEAASMQRWNDHVRPVEFTELDKQAHKMVIAYVIAKLEEDGGNSADWLALIEGGIFELLQRVILTDIKPPVFYKMMQERGDEVRKYVLDKLREDVEGVGADFLSRMQQYYAAKPEESRERRILQAAHFLATDWEFRIIYNTAPFIYGIEETRTEIESRIESHYDLDGVKDMLLKKKHYNFIDLCGQLRFQQRWAQSPRLPKTSVLGHMLIVAVLSYLFSIEAETQRVRTFNNFFAGLFHDLPEVLTRDIISPVKTKIEGLNDVIKDYENAQVEEKILPLLPAHWHGQMRYFITDEFENRAVVDGKVVTELKEDEMNSKYASDEFNAIDGELVRACDHLAAFVEASKSIKHGVTSPQLEDGKAVLYEMYKSKALLGINFGQIFDYFN